MTRTRRIAYLTVIALAAVAVAGIASPVQGSAATPSAGGPLSRGDVDAASSALPTSADPTVSDRTTNIARTGQPGAHATAVSTASTNCDGCHGDAFTFQVIYLDGTGGKTADNVATAWSQCTGCSSAAISVQVVVARNLNQVTVNNRALALNVACTKCITRSAAVQFVLLGGPGHNLTTFNADKVAQLHQTLSDALWGAGPTASTNQTCVRTNATPAADTLEAALVAETGATSARHTIDIQTGS